MSITIIINFLGLTLIGLIIWWFWLAQTQAVKADNQPIAILVKDGVYQPAHIAAVVGQPLRLRFLRQDPSPCAEKVIFADFDISADLPVDEYKEVVIIPDKKGEYAFTCQMQMYRGTLQVN